jgi:hypothetical protein
MRWLFFNRVLIRGHKLLPPPAVFANTRSALSVPLRVSECQKVIERAIYSCRMWRCYWKCSVNNALSNFSLRAFNQLFCLFRSMVKSTIAEAIMHVESRRNAKYSHKKALHRAGGTGSRETIQTKPIFETTRMAVILLKKMI